MVYGSPLWKTTAYHGKCILAYISMCIAAGTNINYLREQIGHESEITTYNSYCFDCKPKAETLIQY